MNNSKTKSQQNCQSQQEQQHSILSNEQSRIDSIQKAPQYMTFNKKIKSGYRINYKNPKQILKSLFILHNQTINIWTHLIGAIIVLIMIVSFFIMIDKAQIQYQLKKYQTKLNLEFQRFNNILNEFQFTMKKFQNQPQIQSINYSNQRQKNIKNVIKELKPQIQQISIFVTQTVKQIHFILSQNTILNQEEQKKKIIIFQQIQQFKNIQVQFQNSIKPIFHKDSQQFSSFQFDKIQKLRNKIKQIDVKLNKHLIQYLQLEKQTPNPYGIPRWPVIVFLFTASACLGFSAIFHMFFPMSAKSFKYFRRMDYAGVILNIIGTGIAPIYYALYCNIMIGTIYITIMVFFGSVLFITLLGNWIQQKRNQHFKPILFGTFGLTYLIPYCHFMITQIFFDNFGDPFKFSDSNFWWFTSSFSYLFGLYIFIKKWPQSKYQNRFDLIGSSHQIWHILCLCGVAATYIAININYETRKQSKCPVY